jgi:hypothetical protein
MSVPFPAIDKVDRPAIVVPIYGNRPYSSHNEALGVPRNPMPKPKYGQQKNRTRYALDRQEDNKSWQAEIDGVGASNGRGKKPIVQLSSGYLESPEVSDMKSGKHKPAPRKVKSKTRVRKSPTSTRRLRASRKGGIDCHTTKRTPTQIIYAEALRMSNAIEAGGSKIAKDKERERMKLLQKKRQSERRKKQQAKSELRPLFNSDNGVPAVGSYDVSRKVKLQGEVTMSKQVSREAPISGVFDGPAYAEKKGKSMPGPADFDTNGEAMLSQTKPAMNHSHTFGKATRSKKKCSDVTTEFSTRVPQGALSGALGSFGKFSRSAPNFATMQGVDYAQHRAREGAGVPLYAPPPTIWDKTGVKMAGPADPRTKLKTDFCRPPREFYTTGVAKNMLTGGSGSPSAAAQKIGGKPTLETSFYE